MSSGDDGKKAEREKAIYTARELLLECCKLNNISQSIFFTASLGIVIRQIKLNGATKEQAVHLLNQIPSAIHELWDTL